MKATAMRKRELTGWIGVLLILFLFPCLGSAAIPHAINYQGYLTNAAGAPVDGTVQMVFSIYDTAAGGAPLWTETQTVTVNHGVYSANLGDVVPINLPFNVQYYLGVRVGTDPDEMTPRRVLTSVGYAYRALYVDIPGDFLTQAQGDTRYVNEGQATSVTSGMINPTGSTSGQVLTSMGLGSPVTWQTPVIGPGSGWVDDGAIVRLATGTDRVGIGTSTPGASNKLEVNGYSVVGSDSKGIRMRNDGSGVDLESLGSPLMINFLGNYNTVLNAWGSNVGIGTDSPQQKLHVNGIARFDVGGGQINVSSPGGWPGLIAYSQNGHRRDMSVWDGGVSLEVSSTSSPPPAGNGVTISENGGNVGIGTTNPEQKLHVSGRARFDVGGGQINMSTPGNWPGIIMYSPNGNRRDITIYDDRLAITVGSSSSPPAFGNGIQLFQNGHVGLKVLEIYGGSDLSEQFEIRKPSKEISVEPGMVVVIDPENPGRLMVSSKAYDRRVAGIVSGAGGLSTGMLMGQKGSEADGAHPVALTGRVYCWADASNGPIEPGDLLTSSEAPGHAMKVTDTTQAQGAILGKAMSSLKSGQGLVLVLVSLQ